MQPPGAHIAHEASQSAGDKQCSSEYKTTVQLRIRDYAATQSAFRAHTAAEEAHVVHGHAHKAAEDEGME